MASEKFANLAETTLSAGYTAAAGSISVTSASGFPTVGVFRVRLGNASRTIFRVDSVSGTTFTGAAEEFDANANSGDAVKIVGSRAVAERWLQSPEASSIVSPSGVSAADTYGPIWKLTAFDQSAWSWINQGSATVVQSGGVVYLSSTSAAGENSRIRQFTAPSTPYKFAFALLPNPGTAANFRLGAQLAEVGTNKIISISLVEGPAVHVIKHNSATSFSSAPFQKTVGALGGPAFFRVGADGTNVTFEYSFDGLNWQTALSEAKATFFTTAPDRVGIIIMSTSSFVGASYLSMLQT